MGKTLWWRGDQQSSHLQAVQQDPQRIDKQKTDDRKGAGGGSLKMIKFPLEMSFFKVVQRVFSDVF